MKKFFSILLSVVLVASHMYLTLGTHFCGGEAVETKIVLGETYLGCGMDCMEESGDDSDKSNTHKVIFDTAPCCKNEFQSFLSTEEFVKVASLISFNIDFSATHIFNYLNLDVFPKSTVIFYTDYSPPPLEVDIQVLFETFLI